MKASERYRIDVEKMLKALGSAETTDESLIKDCNDLICKLRRSRWIFKWSARCSLLAAMDAHRRATRRLRLIQGGNEFLARRSQANLTLIVSNDKLNETISKGA